MALIYLFAVLATLFASWRAMRRTRFFLHVFQLETYKPDRYQSWLREHAGRLLVTPSHLVGGGLLIAATLAFPALPPFWVALVLLIGWMLAFISSRRYRGREKKPFALTNRMKRLVGATGVIALLPVAVGGIAGWETAGLHGFGWYLLGLLVADLGAPLWVLLGAYAMAPVERSIQNGFKRQARATLDARRDLTVIGITGSYGKTSTKFIIAELLKQKYNVLATPSSYNTPMGICLVVNEKLKPDHQVLVLEMGMRYRGDIQELCRIAPPDIGVVTTVGPAHLETMGSIDNIAQEKGDLIEHMRTGGPAILNIDNEHVAAMTKRASGDVWRVSVQNNPDADITAHNIRYDASGASFTVCDDTGTEATFQTQLLGEHNILNILLAVAVGRSMGLRLRQMAHAVRRVEPVEHRLALRKDGPVTVIDDAFNSNPVGARNAVDILSQMDAKRRVIVTPGMVELGEAQWDANKAFGEHIAQQNVDLAVLVGDEQTTAIQEGLRLHQFPDDRMKVFPTLFDAQDFLKSYLRPGDVVLYENDLPDQYET
jgi:UDP-N-acetylmuramoyl-tripeptide--D-alanyl-D-alanine ligase